MYIQVLPTLGRLSCVAGLMNMVASKLTNVSLRTKWRYDIKLIQFVSWRRKWQPTPVFLPGESHGWRSLVGYSPRGRKESDTTQRLHFFTSISI